MPNVTPNEAMCKGCYFWRRAHNYGTVGYHGKCCHKLLDTGEPWKRGENGCESKTLRRNCPRRGFTIKPILRREGGQ